MAVVVIFDVDGTLVDSVDLHANAWVDASKEYGHETNFEDVRKQIGKGGDQFMPVFLSEDELARKGDALEKRRGDILKDRYLPQVTAFPQVRKLFERLRADGKRIALASSAKQDELETYKQIAQIDDLVDVETLSEDAESSKPQPNIFEAALKKPGPNVERRDIIVVGDTPYDAVAAGKARLRTVGLLYGGWPEAELRQAGCIAIYRDPAELLARFDTSPLGDSAT